MNVWLRRLAASLAVVVGVSGVAAAQQGGVLKQGGAVWTPGHTVRILGPGVVGDGGSAAGSSVQGAGYLSEIGIVNTGTPLCIYDALLTASSVHRLCFGANALGGGLISYDAVTGSPLALNFRINGTLFAFPGPGNGDVLGPGTATDGDVVLFSGPSGKIIKDSGVLLSGLAPKNSPAFTGVPTAPTAAVGTNTTQLATTAFVQNQLASAIGIANFYVATTGDDANDCKSSGTACLTIQHATDVALEQISFGGAGVQVNIGAGSYAKGVIINGTLPSAAGAIPAQLKFVGAGSGSTSLANTDTGVCSGFQVLRGAAISVSAMTISTTCGGGSDLWAQLGGLIEIEGDVVLGAAGIAQMFAQDNSVIVLNGSSGNELTMTGDAEFGVLAADNSTIRWFGSGFVTLGGQTYSVAFIDAITNSTVKTGALTFSGSVSGPQYLLGENSSLDVDQASAAVPGSTQGAVSLGGIVFSQGTIANACTPLAGGGGNCSIGTAPTGLGTGAATAMVSGSADYAGTVTMTAGTGASAAGIIYVVPYSKMSWCIASFSQLGTGTWDPRASVMVNYGNFGAFGMQLSWDNNSATLVNGDTYYITYMCR